MEDVCATKLFTCWCNIATAGSAMDESVGETERYEKKLKACCCDCRARENRYEIP